MIIRQTGYEKIRESGWVNRMSDLFFTEGCGFDVLSLNLKEP